MSSSLPTDLPPLDTDAAAHGERVATHLREVIAAEGGAISFARFMELALYAPGLGYYSAGSHKFGEAGDFVTAPEISPLFSRCLARQYVCVLDALGGGEVLEMGAGSGRMAADALLEMERLGTLPERYSILELSAELRQRQHETLSACAPHLISRVEWLDELPREGFSGVIVGNELLDAMPVSKFRYRGEEAIERGIRVEGEAFVWTDLVWDESFQHKVTALKSDTEWVDGYESEINTALEPWIASVAQVLDAGLILLIDYGFPRHEYYHADRTGGTIMCHFRHRAHPDPLVLPGLQDITAHVDFTAVAEAAQSADLEIEGYTMQANFLLGAGINELLEEEALPTHRSIELAQGVKKVVLPSEMGELFKVIGLSRALDGVSLRGFSLRDLRFAL